MKTVFSLTAAAMMALSGSVSAASTFSLSSADIPADFRLSQQHVFKGFGCSGENISPQRAGAIRLPEPKATLLPSSILMRHRKRLVALDDGEYSCADSRPADGG